MPHDVIERLDRGVMHVGWAHCDGAKRRRLKGKIQGLILHLTAASLVGRRGADVVEFVVGKSPSAMAGEAGCLSHKQREPALCGVGGRLLVPLDPAVKGRKGGFQRTLEGSDGLC